MSFLGTILGAVSGIGSTLGNIFSTIHTNHTNKEIAKETNDANVALWREQAKYNSPSEYMKRLQEAGLNPQLAYGNLGQTFASAAPQMQAAKMQAPNISLGDVVQMIGAFSSAEKLTEEAAESRVRQNLLNTQENALVMDMMLKDAQRLKLGAELNLLNYDYNMKSELRKVYTDLAHAQLEQARESISKTRTENALLAVQRSLTSKQIQKLQHEISLVKGQVNEQDARNILWKAGVNPNSHGLDKLIDILISNPSELTNILNKAEKGVGEYIGSMFKPSNWFINDIYNGYKK